MSAREALGFLMCPTGKIEFPDEDTARAALASTRALGGPGGRKLGKHETGAYPCGLCDLWHLTSATQTRRGSIGQRGGKKGRRR